MNDILNKILLADNKFMLELKQPGFTYSNCVPFTKMKVNKAKR